MLLYCYKSDDGVSDGYLFIKDNSLYVGDDPSICAKKVPPHKEGESYGISYSSENIYYNPENKILVRNGYIFHKD